MQRDANLVLRHGADVTCYLRGYIYPQPTHPHEMLPISWAFLKVRNQRRLLIAIFYMSLLTGSTFAYPSIPLGKVRSRVVEHPNKITVQTSGCRSLSLDDLRSRMGAAFDSRTMAYDEEDVEKRYSVKSVISEETYMDGYFDDDDDIDDDGIDDLLDVADDASTGRVQSTKFMRRKRDLTSSGNSNDWHNKDFLYQNMAHATISKRKSRKRRGANNKFHPAWECKKKKVWLKMKDGYFPSRILDGKCKSDTCFFGLYQCNPVKYAIKVLKRDPDDACNPVPLIGRETMYEESWVFKRIHVTVACECGQSWKKKKRTKSSARGRHESLLD